MKSPLDEKVADVAKNLVSGVKDTLEALSGTVDEAVEVIGKGVEKIRRSVRPGAATSVVFLANARVEYGESVVLVGDLEQLGRWNPAAGIAMDGSGYPTWSARLYLSAGTRAEYKYARRSRDGSFSWEAVAANRCVVAEDPDETTARDEVSWA
jgi:hypothetical protein